VSVERVADLADPRLADFTALNDPATRRRLERDTTTLIAEGTLVLEQLLASPHRLRCVLVADNVAERVTAMLGARSRDLSVLVADRDQVETITGFAFHRGVLASADRAPERAVADVAADARVIVAAEEVNDHENLGALFRNAAALGADAVVLDPTTADPLYRRSIRVSLGHALRVPWARAPAWPDAIEELRDLGFAVIALTPARDAMPLRDLAPRVGRGDQIVLLVGSEGRGLSARALAFADHCVRVEIREGVDSLNVATAAAVALHALAPLG
jgi:tRNA G18 (ribose-2'-O)-methylase SpoU